MGREGGDALTIRVCRWKRLKEGNGLSVRIVFHEIRGNDPRYAFAFFFSATRKSRLRMSRCK